MYNNGKAFIHANKQRNIGRTAQVQTIQKRKLRRRCKKANRTRQEESKMSYKQVLQNMYGSGDRQVRDALNPENRKKWDAMSFERKIIIMERLRAKALMSWKIGGR